MNPAEFDRKSITIESENKKINFKANGSTIKFEGYLKGVETSFNAAKLDWESYDRKTNETLQRIMGHLDIDLDNDNVVEPEEYGNYLKINSEQTTLNFLDCNGKKHPVIKISRGTVFKRVLEDGSTNNELYDLMMKTTLVGLVVLLAPRRVVSSWCGIRVRCQRRGRRPSWRASTPSSTRRCVATPRMICTPPPTLSPFRVASPA